MGIVRDLGRVFLRAYKTDGLPSSGNNQPAKSEGIATFDKIDELILNFQTGQSAGMVVFTTKAAMDANLAYAANTGAWVTSDPTAANNGVYQKSGASGSGSWTKVAEFPGTIPAFVTGGTVNARTATGTPPVNALKSGVLYSMNFGATANDDVATLNVDGTGVLPIVERDFTVCDPGRIAGQMVVTYNSILAGGCWVIIAPTRPATTMRRMHRARSYKTLTTGFGTSASRWSESNLTQTGLKMTALGAWGCLLGRAFPDLYMNAGQMLCAEFVPSGTFGDTFGVCLGITPTLPTADDQPLPAAAWGFVWRADGAVQFYGPDGFTNGEQFSGQANAPIQRFVAGDALRIVLRPALQSSGGLILLFKNGDCINSLYFTTTFAIGVYPFVGMLANSAAEVTINFVRLCIPEGGSEKTIWVNTAKSYAGGYPGDGTFTIPYTTMQVALRNHEYCCERLTFALFADFQPVAIGYLPSAGRLLLDGAGWPASKLKASRKVTSGWTKTAGRVNVYERPNVYNGVTNAKIGGIGAFCTSGNPPQAIGAPNANLTLPTFRYSFIVDNASLATLDNTPGAATVNTGTGVLYVNPIANSTRAIGTTTQRKRDLQTVNHPVTGSPMSLLVNTLTVNAHGLAVGNLVNVSGVSGYGYNEKQVRVVLVPDANHFAYMTAQAPTETLTADTGGTVVAYNSGDPNTMTFELPAFDNVLRVPMNPGAQDNVGFGVVLRHLEFGYSNSSVINIERCDLTGCQNVTAQYGYLGAGWDMDSCYGEIIGCRGIGCSGDGFNTNGSLAASDPPDQFPVMVLTECEGYGNVRATEPGQTGGDGASAHWGTALRVDGGRYNANGKAGVGSYINDIHGAECNDNIDAGLGWIGKHGYFLVGNASGCILNNNLYDVFLLPEPGQTIGTYVVSINGNHGSNTRGAHVRLDIVSGVPPAGFVLKGNLLKSGAAPVFGDIINNGPGTLQLVSPTYVT